MEKITARDKNHLRDLIDQAIDNKHMYCDLNFIDVSQVTDMSGLFSGSYFKGDISRWDVSSVTNMSGMFSFSKFNGYISKWNVSNVQFMKAMFACSSFRGDISEWDTSKVTNMDYIFRNSPMTESGKTPVWYKHVSNLDRDYKMSVKDITIILKNPADEEQSDLFDNLKFKETICL